jgi:periplasmic divalent cation tolerance protein
MEAQEYQHLVVYVTIPPYKASEVATALVTEKLAACVSILPTIRSIYSWQKKICDDTEALLMIKTRSDRWNDLKKRVLALHPYELPEIIALPIVAGHEPYLKWIDGESGGDGLR